MQLVEFFIFFFKQKTAYEMRISDWSSDVCSSDLTVEDVTLRITTLRNSDGEVIIVPNGQIVKVTNLSKDWARAAIDVPVSAQADITKIKIGRASCRERVCQYV